MCIHADAGVYTGRKLIVYDVFIVAAMALHSPGIECNRYYSTVIPFKIGTLPSEVLKPTHLDTICTVGIALAYDYG